jgi:hypothetical protein
MSTIEELLGRKSSGSGLEIQECGRMDISRWPRCTLYPQKLELSSPTRGGPSVGIVRSRTQATEFLFLPLIKGYGLVKGIADLLYGREWGRNIRYIKGYICYIDLSFRSTDRRFRYFAVSKRDVKWRKNQLKCVVWSVDLDSRQVSPKPVDASGETLIWPLPTYVLWGGAYFIDFLFSEISTICIAFVAYSVERGSLWLTRAVHNWRSDSLQEHLRYPIVGCSSSHGICFCFIVSSFVDVRLFTASRPILYRDRGLLCPTVSGLCQVSCAGGNSTAYVSMCFPGEVQVCAEQVLRWDSVMCLTHREHACICICETIELLAK